MKLKLLLLKSRWFLSKARSFVPLIDIIAFMVSLLFVLGTSYEYGFSTSIDMGNIYKYITVIYFTIYSIRYLIDFSSIKRQARPFDYVIYILLLFVMFANWHNSEKHNAVVNFIMTIGSNKFLYSILLFLVSFLELSRMIVKILGRKTNPSVILSVSFLFIIFSGSGLLMLPNSTYSGISFIDSLFVSTSAVCVTGLSPVDFASVFTPTGKAIVLILIQIGGLGFMTITSFFGLFFVGNSSLYNRILVKDMLSSNYMNTLLKALLYILLITVIIEAAGAFFIWMSINSKLGMTLEREIAFSVFHSISSFCNAGFSTMPDNLNNYILRDLNGLYITVSVLIISGGIGFPIFHNFLSLITHHIRRIFQTIFYPKRRCFYKKHLVNVNTKIVVVTSLILLVSGSLLYGYFEWNNTLREFPFWGKVTQSFFGAVTPRTAGFNSVNMANLSLQTIMITIFLMWVGGGSQSTAGGIKVNAFATSVANIWNKIRGREQLNIYGREILGSSINRANVTIILSVFIISLSVFVLTITDPHIPFANIIFEVVSAIGTVGLSLNTTPMLGIYGKIIIILLMFIGRVGAVSLLMGIIKQNNNNNFRYPTDDIIMN